MQSNIKNTVGIFGGAKWENQRVKRVVKFLGKEINRLKKHD